MSTITHEQERTEKQRVYDDEILERVKRGLAWLEETHGPGWEDKIDMATLDLSDGDCCVLGQVYGSHLVQGCGFHRARRIEKMSWGELSELGFCHGSEEIRNGIYRKLQACWVDVLTPKVKKEN